MNSPNYVLKINEGELVPKKENSSDNPFKLVVLIIIGIIILGTIIFGENLFKEMSWTSRILLISLFIGICFKGEGSHRVPSPMEIQFYEDCLIVYREKRYINKRLYRKEYDKFFYKDIKKCEYRTRTKKVNIFGIVEGIWYDYNKDGSLPDKPSYHKTTDSSSYFYTIYAQEVDFVAEFEKHSPIKVVVEDN